MKRERRISLRFDEKAWSFIKHLSVDTCESMNDIVGGLVVELMKKHEKNNARNVKNVDSEWRNGKMNRL